MLDLLLQPTRHGNNTSRICLDREISLIFIVVRFGVIDVSTLIEIEGLGDTCLWDIKAWTWVRLVKTTALGDLDLIATIVVVVATIALLRRSTFLSLALSSATPSSTLALDVQVRGILLSPPLPLRSECPFCP